MTRLFLFSLSIILIGGSVLSHGTEKSEKKDAPPVPSRELKPSAKASPSLGLRKNLQKQQETISSYPQKIDSEDWAKIINAPYDGKSTTEAVTIKNNIQVSWKVGNARYTNIIKASHPDFINEVKVFDRIELPLRGTEAQVHPGLSVHFKEIVQRYQGATATSQKDSQGYLIKYRLMRPSGDKDMPVEYPIKDSNSDTDAIATLSITVPNKIEK